MPDDVLRDYLIAPDPGAPRLTRRVVGTDHTGAKIEIVDEEGNVAIYATNDESLEGARSQVEALTASIQIGRIYEGKVTSVKDFGAFVELVPGKDGLCHISELSEEYVSSVGDICRVGDMMRVKVIAVDDQEHPVAAVEVQQRSGRFAVDLQAVGDHLGVVVLALVQLAFKTQLAKAPLDKKPYFVKLRRTEAVIASPSLETLGGIFRGFAFQVAAYDIFCGRHPNRFIIQKTFKFFQGPVELPELGQGDGAFQGVAAILLFSGTGEQLFNQILFLI